MQKFVQLLANNVTEREAQLLNLAYNSLRKKVADALITIYKKYGAGNTEFAIEISGLYIDLVDFHVPVCCNSEDGTDG